jgi:hypothetical protein
MSSQVQNKAFVEYLVLQRNHRIDEVEALNALIDSYEPTASLRGTPLPQPTPQTGIIDVQRLPWIKSTTTKGDECYKLYQKDCSDAEYKAALNAIPASGNDGVSFWWKVQSDLKPCYIGRMKAAGFYQRA